MLGLVEHVLPSRRFPFGRARVGSRRLLTLNNTTYPVKRIPPRRRLTRLLKCPPRIRELRLLETVRRLGTRCPTFLTAMTELKTLLLVGCSYCWRIIRQKKKNQLNMKNRHGDRMKLPFFRCSRRSVALMFVTRRARKRKTPL